MFAKQTFAGPCRDDAETERVGNISKVAQPVGVKFTHRV